MVPLVSLISAIGDTPVIFKPVQGERYVKLDTTSIAVSLPERVKLGSGNISLLGVSTAVLHIPWTSQKYVFRVNDQSSMLLHAYEAHTARNGVGQAVTTLSTELRINSSRAVELAENRLLLHLQAPLRAETTYTLTIDSSVVVPATHIEPLSFSTELYTDQQPENWSEQCDPWKNRMIDLQKDYVSKVGAWSLCPAYARSPSGCGDFEHDVRMAQCTSIIDIPSCKLAERMIYLQPQSFHAFDHLHVCFNQRINVNQQYMLYAREWSLPTSTSAHRNVWGRWGEYSFIPSERWIHNVEHGGVAFLYDPCVAPRDVQLYRDFISGLDGDDGGKFRWVSTPYHLNRHQFVLMRYPFMIVAYGYVFASHCFHVDEMTAFIWRHYRQAVEDFAPGGNYGFLHVDVEPPRRLSDTHGISNCAQAVGLLSAVCLLFAFRHIGKAEQLLIL